MHRSQFQRLAIAAALMVSVCGCSTTPERMTVPPPAIANAPPTAAEQRPESPPVITHAPTITQTPVIKLEAASTPPTVIFAGPPVAAVAAPFIVQTVSNNSAIEPLPTTLPQEPSAAPLPPNPIDPPEIVSSGSAHSPSSGDVRDITMANILASVAGRNPQVAFATQRYAEAYARLIAARVLWLPSINSGVGWNNHAGPIQNTNGLVQNINRSSLTAGLGVQTIGAGSPVVPGLFANFHAADAIFQPRIANRAAAVRDAAVQTTINDLLLDTALAYLNLLRAHQLHAITLDIQYHAEELAKTTADFARAGAGTEADADRAATELAIRQNEVVRAEEEMQVASAQLVQLLNENPRYVLRPMEPAIAPVELVPLDTPIDSLLPTGLTKRPELAEAQHLVGEAVHRYRSEKMSPWMPNVLMGTSYAGFGGGTGSQIDNTAGRFDLDAIAYWQVRDGSWRVCCAPRGPCPLRSNAL